MNSSHRKFYLAKKKKPQRSSFQSDPISTGIRASILSKVQSIYDHIQQLHARSSFLKTYVSTRSSVLNSQTSRPLTTSNNMGMKRTSFSCTSRKNQSSYKRQELSLTLNHNSEILNKTCGQAWRPPMSQSNIRELLKKRTKMLYQKDNAQMLKNPYYKIMKRRVKTSYDEALQETALKNSKIQETEERIKTEENNVQQTISDQDLSLMKSNYTIKEETKRSGQNQGAIRQKSETKIYEQIKKYFEEKYCSYRAPRSPDKK